jgi:hypothetical protein
MVDSTADAAIRSSHHPACSSRTCRTGRFYQLLLALCLFGFLVAGCGSAERQSAVDLEPSDEDSTSSSVEEASVRDSSRLGSDASSERDDASAADENASGLDAGDSGTGRAPATAAPDAGATTSGASDGGTSGNRDASAVKEADGGSSLTDAAIGDASAAAPGGGCDLPTTFRWKGGGPLAQPRNGWLSMKDVTHVVHDGLHILYFTTFQTGWGAGMMTFKDWPDAATAPQLKTNFGVAPTLFYFAPKKLWVIAYQWGAHKFSYRTSTDPTNPSGWSSESSLYRTALPAGSPGPIDQTIICDRAKCFLYYAADNGHIYKSSMPIGSFPGEFSAATDSGIAGTAQNLFEGVQVYKLQGSDAYLMLVEAQGSARYFRAFTATNLDGPWALLTNDFAVKKNVALAPDWTNDISHGDLVRSSPDQTFTVDPCNLQLVFQGRNPGVNTEYGRLPYRLGLLTLAH